MKPSPLAEHWLKPLLLFAVNLGVILAAHTLYWVAAGEWRTGLGIAMALTGILLNAAAIAVLMRKAVPAGIYTGSIAALSVWIVLSAAWAF